MNKCDFQICGGYPIICGENSVQYLYKRKGAGSPYSYVAARCDSHQVSVERNQILFEKGDLKLITEDEYIIGKVLCE